MMTVWGMLLTGDNKANWALLAKLEATTLEELRPEDSRRICQAMRDYAEVTIRDEEHNLLWPRGPDEGALWKSLI